MSTLVSTGSITIIDVNDGQSIGLTSINAILPASETGVVSSYAGAETSFKIAEAGKDITANYSYFVSGTGGGVSYRDSDDTADRTLVGPADGGLGGSNLLTLSEQFDLWNVNGLTAVTANNMVAPDGTTTADTSTGGAGTRYVIGAVTAGVNFTYSLYVKPADITKNIWIYVDGPGGIGSCTFAPATLTTIGKLGIAVSGQIISVGDGWYRMSMTFAPLATGTNACHIYPLNADLHGWWGAQLVSGSATVEYVPTNATVRSGNPGYMKIVSLTQDASWIDIVARRIGFPDTSRRFSMVRSNRGTTGANGINGATGQRGSVTAYVTGQASWTDAAANGYFTTNYAGVKVLGDTITEYGSGFAQTKMWSGSAWSLITQVVDGNLIVNGSVTSLAIAANTITATNMATDAITANSIVAGAISTSKIAANAVTAAQIAANTITASNIATATITAVQIAAGTITASNIAAGTITASNIATDTITAAQIAAGAIGASEIAAGSITADKLAIGDLSNMCNNPGFELGLVGWIPESAAWYSDTSTGAVKSGTKGITRSANGLNACRNSFDVQVSVGDVFYAAAWVKDTNAGVNVGYVRIRGKDKTGAEIWTSAQGALVGGATWTLSEVTGTVPASVVTINVELVATNTTGLISFDEVKLQRVSGVTLIQNGAITTDKIAVNAITADKIAANSISATNIIGGTITGDKIAANTISASKILAGSITANEIAGGTITGDRVVAGTITADLIDARGLSIKDAAGNIILAAGTALDFANVGGALKPANNAGQVLDTRSVNNGPILYPVGTTEEFKFRNVLGSAPGAGAAPPGSADFGGLTTLKTWGDSSGGSATQTFKSADGTFVRSAGNSSVTWGPWVVSFDAQNKPAFATDVTGIPYDKILSNDAATTLGFNPSFELWNSTLPDAWSSWASNTITKESSLVRFGKNSAKFVNNGQDGGIMMMTSWTIPMATGTIVSGTVDIYLESRTSGLPGMLFRVFTNAALTAYVDTCVQPVATTGGWQRVPFTARVGAGQGIYGIQVYIMGSWGGMPSGPFSGTCYFDGITFAFLDSSVDNKAITLTASGSLVGAGTGAVTITGLGYSGAMNANYTTNTNQLTDGSNLGGTASWGGVSGSGKPQDNATVGANSSNLTVGVGGNMISNSDLSAGVSNWATTWNAGGVANAGPVWDLAGVDWIPGGGHQVGVSRAGTDASASNWFDIGYVIPIHVVNGARYEFSAYLASHRAPVSLNVVWYNTNSSGVETYVAENGIQRQATNDNGGKNLSTWERVTAFLTVPSGATYCKIFLRGWATTSSGPYFWGTRFFMGQAGAAQTEFSPWSAGGAAGAFSELSKITASNASTFIADLAVNTLQIKGNAVTTDVFATAGGQALPYSWGNIIYTTITVPAPCYIYATGTAYLNMFASSGERATADMYISVNGGSSSVSTVSNVPAYSGWSAGADYLTNSHGVYVGAGTHSVAVVVEANRHAVPSGTTLGQLSMYSANLIVRAAYK